VVGPLDELDENRPKQVAGEDLKQVAVVVDQERRRGCPCTPPRRGLNRRRWRDERPDPFRLLRALGNPLNLKVPMSTRPRSEARFACAVEVMPGGVNSPVRDGTPVFIKSAHGPYIVDEDGNQ
jgi:hypothetical protein